MTKPKMQTVTIRFIDGTSWTGTGKAVPKVFGKRVSSISFTRERPLPSGCAWEDVYGATK